VYGVKENDFAPLHPECLLASVSITLPRNQPVSPAGVMCPYADGKCPHASQRIGDISGQTGQLPESVSGAGVTAFLFMSYVNIPATYPLPAEYMAMDPGSALAGCGKVCIHGWRQSPTVWNNYTTSNLHAQEFKRTDHDDSLLRRHCLGHYLNRSYKSVSRIQKGSLRHNSIIQNGNHHYQY
jgi:hypothetical protein